MIRIFNRYVPIKYIVILLLELLLLLGTGYLAVGIRFTLDSFQIDSFPALFGKLFLITVICQVCLAYNRLYTELVPAAGILYARLYQSFAVAWGFLFILYFLLPGLEIGRGIFLLHITLSPLCLGLFRKTIARLLTQDKFRNKVLIVGTGHLAKLVGRHLMAHHDPGFEVIGFIDQDPQRIGAPVINPKVIGTPDQIPDIVRDYDVKKVIVALPERRGQLPLTPLLACKVSGVEVLDGLSFYERLTGKILVEGLNPGWLIFSEGFTRQQLTMFIKRIVDLLSASIGLLVTAPLLVLLAALIKLDSPGPVLYRQHRVGEGQRRFTVIKLRSMHEQAESDGKPIWAAADDSRTTRIGYYLRKLRLDELPQMINVLRGEMTFVGPRPERPEFVAMLSEKIPYYNLRHTVKPGITGWAQVRYRYGSSIEDAIEKMHLDLYYIKNLSLGLDLLVLLETVKIVLLGKGAR
ncbi:MAG: TIGR03013 family XrtA/PEP-CTERM system glycosyltransferase [Nitrospirota bacterium]